MIGVLGINQIDHCPQIVKALNPVYSYNLLMMLFIRIKIPIDGVTSSRNAFKAGVSQLDLTKIISTQ